MRQAICVMFLFLASCAKASSSCLAPKQGSGQDRIVAFGDSQAAGHATETSPGCGYSYANILAQYYNLTVDNQAIAGTQLTSITSNSQYVAVHAYSFRPTDRVVFIIGFNDMRANDVDYFHLELYKRELKDTILFIAPKVRSLVLGNTPTPLIYDYNGVMLGSPKALLLYRQANEDVVKELNLANVRLIDVDSTFKGNASFYVADQTHFNIQGQSVIAEQFILSGGL